MFKPWLIMRCKINLLRWRQTNVEQSQRALQTSASHSSIALSERGGETLCELSGYPSLGKYLLLPEPDALNSVQTAEICWPQESQREAGRIPLETN